MLYCSSECGSISIMQLRTICCNTHVYTFHVCLCLLALTFVCNSTYLLKCSFQIYQNTNYQFLQAFSYIIYNKNSIDMRILSTELSQLKRIAIINAISNCVCKGFPYQCSILKFNILANRFE